MIFTFIYKQRSNITVFSEYFIFLQILQFKTASVHLWIILWSWKNEVQETGSFLLGRPVKTVVCITEREALRKVGYEAWRMRHVWAKTDGGWCCFK
jgi:hypothetical protein